MSRRRAASKNIKYSDFFSDDSDDAIPVPEVSSGDEFVADDSDDWLNDADENYRNHRPGSYDSVNSKLVQSADALNDSGVVAPNRRPRKSGTKKKTATTKKKTATAKKTKEVNDDVVGDADDTGDVDDVTKEVNDDVTDDVD
eukprot:CAMPEP_0201545818 /NCGR_PEP_ID=MMETSP0173_2-20130828/2244_1 /ASSEMBLY_ACC=CAM_ASM_000268 /TAXON_ID=218659 /ORGANISM="Vexillifera sp., Strain DIVA3 564/2" /LENGTH=141 /DNA_ID=CAMNT_0047954325 /DNA_START=30 /DNA_END=452 /DNA_ORIENTATION=-